METSKNFLDPTHINLDDFKSRPILMVRKKKSTDSLDTVVTVASHKSGNSLIEGSNIKLRMENKKDANLRFVMEEESEPDSLAIRKAEVKDFDMKTFQNEINHAEVIHKNIEFRSKLE